MTAEKLRKERESALKATYERITEEYGNDIADIFKELDRLYRRNIWNDDYEWNVKTEYIEDGDYYARDFYVKFSGVFYMYVYYYDETGYDTNLEELGAFNDILTAINKL